MLDKKDKEELKASEGAEMKDPANKPYPGKVAPQNQGQVSEPKPEEQVKIDPESGEIKDGAGEAKEYDEVNGAKLSAEVRHLQVRAAKKELENFEKGLNADGTKKEVNKESKEAGHGERGATGHLTKLAALEEDAKAIVEKQKALSGLENRGNPAPGPSENPYKRAPQQTKEEAEFISKNPTVRPFLDDDQKAGRKLLKSEVVTGEEEEEGGEGEEGSEGKPKKAKKGKKHVSSKE